MYNFFRKSFHFYKKLGDDAFDQLSEEDFYWVYDSKSYSIITLIKHISGKMQSHFGQLKTEDGVNLCRKSDSESLSEFISKVDIILIWENGWIILFDVLEQIKDKDWKTIIVIRGKKLTINDALILELEHYSYHIDQIVFIANMLKNQNGKRCITEIKDSENDTAKYIKEDRSAEIHDNSSPVCFANTNEVRDDYKV